MLLRPPRSPFFPYTTLFRSGTGYSSEWRVADGYVDDIVVAQARYADLVVVGQAEPDSPPMATPSDLAEDVTMASERPVLIVDRKSTRLNSSHTVISYAVFCL